MKNKQFLNQFRDILRQKGLKFTPQRVAVLEEITHGHGHRECEDIYLSLKRNGKHISRATVYRTMDLLIQNNFARKMELGDGRSRYENKVDSPHHDHLICTICGNIVEFVNQDVEDIQNKIAKSYHFKLQRHIHHLFGICRECQ